MPSASRSRFSSAPFCQSWSISDGGFGLLQQFPSDLTSRQIGLGLGVAFLPAAVVGLATHSWIEAHLFGPVTVAGALVVGGVVMLVIEYTVKAFPITGVE